MSKKLNGKVAVVTGASKGIGAEIAKQLAAEGASVVVNYASSKSGADKVVADITAKGGKAVAVQADVAKPEDIKKLFAETKKAFGKLDVLVNNAGIYTFAPLEDITPEHYHKQFDLNVLGSDPDHPGSGQAFWCRGRQRDQHQLGREQTSLPRHNGVCSYQGGGGLHHSNAQRRTRPEEGAGQHGQSGDGCDRGERFRQERRR